MSAEGQTAPSATTLRRLGFVKFLFSLAVEQSEKPEPMSSAAVLHCHDAVEFFLDVAVEVLNVRAPSGVSLLDYWPSIDPVVPGGLAHKEPIRRLTKTRGNLKHHGTLVTGLDARDLTEWTRRFLVDNSPRCFGVDFERVSLADLVWHQDVRADLQRAEAARAADNLDDSFAHAAIALKRLLDDYTNSARGFAGKSPFEFIGAFDLPSPHMMGLRSGFGQNNEVARLESKFKEYVEKVNKVIEAMHDGMNVLMLGLDYRRFTKFERFTPHVYMTAGSLDYKVSGWAPPPHTALTRTADDADFCIEFVVETALRLQDVDLALPRQPTAAPVSGP